MRLSLKHHLGAAALVLLLLTPALAARTEEGLNLTARSFVIMDADTGVILLSYNPQLFIPPASTLKVMTAMFVMEHLNMDDKVKVSPRAAAAPASKICIKPGEVYTVKELLYALLLSSANDAARALAERVSGSEAAFARELTHWVRQHGAYRTTAGTANGLPAPNQFSTAQDLAIMFRRAMQQYPELAKIMETKYYHIQGERELRNHNRFLWTTPLAVAGKTGYTRASKHTYVGMFRKNDRTVIISIMGSKQKWRDLRPLIAKAFELEGTPIAKLPPREEKLRFARKHMGKAAQRRTVRKRHKHKLRRRSTKVALGAATAVPRKKHGKHLKRKPRKRRR